MIGILQNRRIPTHSVESAEAMLTVAYKSHRMIIITYTIPMTLHLHHGEDKDRMDNPVKKVSGPRDGLSGLSQIRTWRGELNQQSSGAITGR